MEIKGQGAMSLLQALEKELGPEAKATVLGAAPEEVRCAVEGGLVASRFYPVELNAALQQAIYDTVGAQSWELSHALGVIAARLDFGGVYRIFLRAISNDRLWNGIERAFRQYNSQGLGRWLERTDGSARGIITGVEGYNEGLWQSVAGRCQGLLALAGAKRPRVYVIRCDSTECELRATWTV